jgi:hypothetical protein
MESENMFNSRRIVGNRSREQERSVTYVYKIKTVSNSCKLNQTTELIKIQFIHVRETEHSVGYLDGAVT